jgi:hypothetical protein
MPMVNGRWTSVQKRNKPIQQRQLAFEYFYYVRRIHNKLGVLLQKNGHIKSGIDTIEAIEQLLKLICIFINKPEFCTHIGNPF